MRHLLRTALVVILATAGGLSVSAHALASYTTAERYEQYRYARETIDLTYSQYVARQTDFRAAGCKDGTSGCTKPSPYNAFDWTDDGCSGAHTALGFASNLYRNLFNQPCRLHDFGYRNFGKGLTLYKHEDMRAYIDGRFRTEMFRLCNDKYAGLKKTANRLACQVEANGMYAFVRNASYWGTSGSPPPRPDSCPNGDYSGSDHDGTCGSPPPTPDYCPSGDYSGSAYDGTCGAAPPTPDYCPGGDYSGSAYDGACGTLPATQSVTISWGSRAPSSYCGGDTSCTYLTISWSGFSSGNHTITPYFDGQGDWCAGASCSSSLVRSGSSGTLTGYWAVGYCVQHHTISATVDGVGSNGIDTTSHGC